MLEPPVVMYGEYRFQWGENYYSYRTVNKRSYSNAELKNIIALAHLTGPYYNEPSTEVNDPDGNLVRFPRLKSQDRDFLINVSIVLKYTQSEEKKQLINRIMNECLIIDEEPAYKDGISLDSPEVRLDKVEEFGSCHIDNHRLKEVYRDAINMSAHKYAKKYHGVVYGEKEEKEIDLLLSDK